jgi:hypothetical protein
VNGGKNRNGNAAGNIEGRGEVKIGFIDLPGYFLRKKKKFFYGKRCGVTFNYGCVRGKRA